jgi:hypothetical protein
MARVWHDRPSTPRVTGLPRPFRYFLTWGYSVGAGEGNRTLMTSLEGCPHIVAAGSDLGVRVAADSRSCPVITLVNGTLMAQRTTAARQIISSVGHSPSYPGFSGDGKGLPAGSIEASPCRPWRFWGRALPARARR